MFYVLFRGVSCREHGLIVTDRPDISAPVKNVELIEIPGRTEKLTLDNKRYEEIRISVEFNFLTKVDEWNEKFRRAKKWLSGSGELEFSDDTDYFYKVYYAEIGTCEREMKRIGRFKAEFVCEPFAYLKSGKREYDKSEVLYNLYHESHPIYKITGEGVCDLTVNGCKMRANIGQNLVIDTERMMAYRTDGTMNNTAVSGDYQDLYLKEGENRIEITSGFRLKVVPNWRSL